MTNINKQQTIKVIIKSRKKTFYDGNAKSITSNNDKGVFDILPQHANFITMIKDFIKVIGSDNSVEEIKVESGVLRFYKDKADVYLTVS